ncbi:MAG: AMP-binding protein [Nocardioides alkalitolerans]
MRIIDHLDKGASLDPDRALLVADDVVITHAEGQARSHAVAAGLRAAGMRAGDTVGILAPNGPDGLLAMFGVWRAGGVLAPLNPYNALDATRQFLVTTGCRWLFLHSTFADAAATLLEDVPSLELVVCLDRPFDGGLAMDELLAAGVSVDLGDGSDPTGGADQVCVYWPTGGTTGRSKAVVWTNAVFARLLETASRHWPARGEMVNLAVAPMTHAAGVMAVLYAALGATIVVRQRFDADDVLDQIEAHRVTHLFLPPTAYYDLCRAQRERPRDCGSLDMLLLSAAPVSPERLGEGVELFGPCVAQSWGQAEAPFLLTFLTPEDVAEAAAGTRPERLASCGRATFSSLVAVMGPDGALLPPGERGELVARGALVTPGYLDREQDTREMRRSGWHHTGDVGFIDEGGYVYVVDRLKDMIITGGFNVYAAEVESALLALPEVGTCAVVGVPDERWGEAVVAFVVAADQREVDPARLIAATRTRLGSVKAPKRVHVVAELPHTPVGKIDKRAVRDRLAPTALGA